MELPVRLQDAPGLTSHHQVGIVKKLRRSATLLSAQGRYSGQHRVKADNHDGLLTRRYSTVLRERAFVRLLLSALTLVFMIFGY